MLKKIVAAAALAMMVTPAFAGPSWEERNAWRLQKSGNQSTGQTARPEAAPAQAAPSAPKPHEHGACSCAHK
ncbi:hypothetical protein [Anaeromyxobacter paludicola]|uniref:Uncharacterized protein n=1 Tax=Anaeromyxobacter paludicola TaxID=2918171 RepID=A0ABN6NA09_9BACT|nr:hypothetical protein [Anaeromyxobacter paludicola]BDG10073.1 hypothetical protein AMPC_31860 [Anaeromyxobacter paludicola]